jgi:hypothetical protein
MNSLLLTRMLVSFSLLLISIEGNAIAVEAKESNQKM